MYNVYLDLYIDCAGTPITTHTLDFTNDCGVSFSITNLQFTLEEEVSPLCPTSVPNSTCNGGTLPGFRRYRFETSLFLAPCNNWTISWDICCRNTMQNIQGTPGTYVEATLNNANGVCDNSPIFSDSGIPYVCLGNDLLYSPGATDPDGHTMEYALIAARFYGPPPTPVNYQAGYTGAQPLPGMTIDPSTGQLTFAPTVQGNYTVVVQVTTYDANGVLIGTVMRDLMFVAVACNGIPPITNGLTNAQNALITGPNSLEVCAGQNFCVDVAFEDEDPNDVISLMSNVAGQLPGATFQVNGTNPAIGTLCWTPAVALLPATVYVQADDGDCPIMNIVSTSFLISESLPPQFPPDAGIDGDATSCDAGPAIALFPLLGGTPDAGGTWLDPDGNAHSGTFTPGADPFGAYTYTVGSACDNATAIVTVTSDQAGAAGTDGSFTICSADAPVDLFNYLGGTPSAGGTWSGPAGAMNGMYDPALHAPGLYTYTLVGGPCPGASASVTVTELSSANAGIDATVNLCSTSPITDLFALLGAGAQPGGTWSGPSPITGNYSPAQHAPGVYTYTVVADPACPAASASITVIENLAPDAGTNANLTICATAGTVDLFLVLNGAPQAGGVWAGPAGAMDGNYDPAVHAPGNYSYTVQGIAPCANSTSFVIVTEVAAPNAGSDGTVEVCGNGDPVDLFAALGGTPATTGTWSGPSAITGIFDPALHMPGDYEYTVTGPAGCEPATATVTVDVLDPPDAGTMGTITLCSDAAPIDLFTLLNGTPETGGTWSGPSAINGMFDPAIHTAGVYIYTVTGIAPCMDASATVTVDLSQAADAGLDGSVDFCSTDAAADLFALLGASAQPGGTWTGPSAITGYYDPGAHVSGQYTYTVPGTGACADATATITVNEFAPVDAGTDASLELCSNGAAIDLFSQLNGTPQTGGTWTGPDVIDGTFDPTIHAEGIYSYTVIGNVACPDAVAAVDVAVTPAADAGVDVTVEVCASDSPVDLFTALGPNAQAGGTWSGPSMITGSYDPAVHDQGAYMYSIAGNGSCPPADAIVTVVEALPGNAGTDATLDLCSSDNVVDLFSSLGGSPQSGGTWSGPGPLNGGSFDPSVDAPGVYTYTINAGAPCPQASATVTVSVEVAVNAGTDGSVTLCDGSTSVDLFTALGGSPQAGGTWSGPSAITGIYDPAIHDPGVYTYTIAGGALCTGSSATVSVSETGSPDAGDDVQISLCSSDAPVDLFDLLGGTPDAGGEWSDVSGPFDGIFDPGSDPEGNFIYTIDATAPCVGDQATVTVTINPAPDAGTDAAITVCENGGANNLFSSLGGTPQPGGTWAGPNGAFSGLYDPSVDGPGDYVYSIAGSAPCGTATATVSVSESGSPNAGLDAIVSVCPDDAPLDLFNSIGGTPDAGGVWTGPSSDMTGVFDPSIHIAGVYTYSIEATPPCTSDASTVTVNIVAGADAGQDASVTVCGSGGSIDLFAELGGTPQTGGTWTGPAASFTGEFDPAVHPEGVYVYTVAGIGSCGSASAEVSVSITSDPNAGADSALVICANDATMDLFTLLEGSPDPGGTWAAPVTGFTGTFDPAVHPSGAYTYTVEATAPCLADQAVISITVEPVANAGTSTSIDICPGAPSQDLWELLGGATPGGTWSGPAAGFDGTFDPSIHEAGVYTYTLDGGNCGEASSTITVDVLDGANAGEDAAIELCGSDPAFALADMLGGTPDPGGVWTNSSGSVVPPTLDPATATSGSYTYTVTGSIECPSAQASLTVTITQPPQAGVSGILEMCADEGQVSLFDGLSGTLDAGGTWTDPSGQPHGTVVDPLNDIPGTYTYTVSNGSCPPASSNVNVIIYSAPDAGDDNAVAFCTNEGGVSLMSMLEGTPDPGGIWTGPDGMQPPALFLPATSPPGEYTYTVSGSTACGTDSATIVITVSAAANAGASGSITLCQNDEAISLFDQLDGTPDPGGFWTAPDGSVVNDSFVPSVEQGGVYTYNVEPEAPCVLVTSTVTVDLLPVPSPQILVTNSDACTPVEVTISHDYEGSASCTWMFGNGEFVQDCGPVTMMYDEAGSYDITLIIDAGNGCGSNTIYAAGAVNVFDQPVAEFEPLPNAVGTHLPNVYFHNYSQGASSYEWEMGGTGTYTSEDVNHTFPAQLGDQYDVCLIAYASPQCADTICKVITVNDALNLHVPNAFSPDDDGINELFQPVIDGVDPERYHFYVFDRWGAELFSTTDPNAGWDGRSASGDEVPQGVYVWKVHLKDSYSGERVEQIGHVTLIR